MTVVGYTDPFMKIYSTGIERAYRGTSVEYEDAVKTLIYYYYPNYKRLYVLSGDSPECGMPNVEEKVRIVARFDEKQVWYFNKYLKSIIKNKKIYYLCDEFFLDLEILLGSRRPAYSSVEMLYRRYTDQDEYKNLDWKVGDRLFVRKHGGGA